jgi:hypothetical protein
VNNVPRGLSRLICPSLSCKYYSTASSTAFFHYSGMTTGGPDSLPTSSFRSFEYFIGYHGRASYKL